jgi:hypothetical protein
MTSHVQWFCPERGSTGSGMIKTNKPKLALGQKTRIDKNEKSNIVTKITHFLGANNMNSHSLYI